MAPPWVTMTLCYLQLDCPLMIRAQPSVCCHAGPKVQHFTVKKKKALHKTENVQISNFVFISLSVLILFCRLIFTSLVCLCRSTLPFCCNFTSVYCKIHFILKLYFLNILWCALWYLYNLLITAFFLFVLIWRTELSCVYHYGCVSQGAKSKYHKHLLFPSKHLRSFLLTEHSH